MKKVDMKLVGMYKDGDSYLMIFYDRKNNEAIIGLENDTHFHSFVVDKDGVDILMNSLRMLKDLMEHD